MRRNPSTARSCGATRPIPTPSICWACWNSSAAAIRRRRTGFYRPSAFRPKPAFTITTWAWPTGTWAGWPRPAACFQTAARLQPASYDAHFNLGAALQGLQRVDAAIAAYEKALALNKNPGVLNNLGVAWLDRRDFPKAIACLQQALKLQPAHPDALYNLASALQESGQPEKAIPYYEKRAALPNPPSALPRQLGLACQKSNRWQEAETWYRKAMEEHPTAFLCNNLALVLEHRFAFAEAESLLRRAVSLRPEFAEAFSNLGNVMLAAGDPKKPSSPIPRPLTSSPVIPSLITTAPTPA